MSTPLYVDMSFPIRGTTIPRDHGYALYGAVSRAIPSVHGANWIAIHGIAAKQADTNLTLERAGRLRIRVPSDRIGELLALAGTSIEIAGCALEIGAPTVHPLVPAAILDARLVVIRLTGGIPKPFDNELFERRFLAEGRRQLVALGVAGELVISGRQSLRVGGQRVIGCSVRVGGLSSDDSIKLQIDGIGGKRTMGCGVFRPARIKQQIRKVA
jgi:CRISPR-associated protein Cas6